MTNEEKLRMEELEWELEELNAANAQAEGYNDKADDGKKPGFFGKVKDGFGRAINHKFSIKDVVIATGVVAGAILSVKYAYEKGVSDGRSESEFEGTVLPDSSGQLALETNTDAQEVFEATISDLEDNFEVESVEEM